MLFLQKIPFKLGAHLQELIYRERGFPRKTHEAYVHTAWNWYRTDLSLLVLVLFYALVKSLSRMYSFCLN